MILDEQRSFAAAEGFLQIPGVERGTESFEVEIPQGLRLSLVDLATPEAATLSGADIEAMPARGATGRVRITVKWFHPKPMGNVTFRLRVYASPDGTPPPVTTHITEPGSHTRMRRLIDQDAPVDVAVSGPLVETFRNQVVARGGRIEEFATGQAHMPGLARPFLTGVEVAAIVAVSIALIAATCVALGFATFGAVLLIAMQKGYDIEDAGYKVAVGEGESRQEHEMVFNLRQP
ncbi:MAG: hypothetical protein RIG84_04665 [Roseovarius sp.]